MNSRVWLPLWPSEPTRIAQATSLSGHDLPVWQRRTRVSLTPQQLPKSLRRNEVPGRAFGPMHRSKLRSRIANRVRRCSGRLSVLGCEAKDTSCGRKTLIRFLGLSGHDGQLPLPRLRLSAALRRQLSTFISRIVAWCTSRSMAASVMVLSVKILPHSPNGTRAGRLPRPNYSPHPATAFTSRYSSTPNRPHSRPLPDCL